MFDLARPYKYLKGRWDRATENRRLINREKSMINESVIVLSASFYKYVIDPAVTSHTSFTSVSIGGGAIVQGAQLKPALVRI